jgi:uncharacterized protein
VVIDSIPPEGISFSERHEREWLDNIPEFSAAGDTRIEGPIVLSGRVSQEGMNLRLRGEVATEFHTLCTRCGDEVNWPLKACFELVLMPGQEKPAPELADLSPEEMSQIYYQGPVVELDEYFRQELALEIPIQILCREDCRGLCPRCGANFNRETCSCAKDPGDPRFAIFRNLKIN